MHVVWHCLYGEWTKVKAEGTVLIKVQWLEEAQSNAASFVQDPVIPQHFCFLGEHTHC